MDSKVAPVVGIDLGTTTTGIACYNEATGKAEMIGDDKFLFPSVVRMNIDSSAPVFVGIQAERNPRRNEFRICDAKRLIGRKLNDRNVEAIRTLFEQELTTDSDGQATIRLITKDSVRDIKPQQISAEVLKHAAARYYDRYFPTGTTKPPLKAVITVPANFSESQRAATQEAAQIAGIEVIRLIAEPTAAAIAYLLDNSRSENYGDGLHVVFDFGGGTLDVSLVQKTGTQILVKGTAGNTLLGGRDIDSLLFDHVVKILGKSIVMSYEKRLAKKKQKQKIDAKRARLRNECKTAKEFLSGTNHNSYTFDLAEYFDDDDEEEEESPPAPVKITREFFEELIYQNLLPKIMSPVAQVLRDTNTEIGDITTVLLAGGSSKIPKIRHALQAFFKDIELINTMNPDHVVSLGAAHLAHRIVNDNGETIIDCVPENIGLAVRGTDMSVILNKNSPLPVENTKGYTTMSDNQIMVSLEIYEGPHELVKDNTPLCLVSMSDIPALPKGQAKIDATMRLNESGVLHFSASCLNNDTHVSHELTIGMKGRLTEEQVKSIQEGNDLPTLRPEIEGVMKDFINKVQQLEEKCAELPRGRNSIRARAVGSISTFRSFYNSLAPNVSMGDVTRKMTELNAFIAEVEDDKSRTNQGMFSFHNL